MERYYRFAGMGFRVSVPDQWMYQSEGDLKAYRTEPGPWDQSLEFEVVDQLDEPVGEQCFLEQDRYVYQLKDGQVRYDGPMGRGLADAHARILRQGKFSRVQIKRDSIIRSVPAHIVLRSMEPEHQIVSRGGILLHASFIRWKDRAILFTAASGVGKSTQAELWCRLRGAELINGDRVAVMPGPNGFQACGVPYPGSSGVCKNETLPLAAVVCLSQAPQSVATRLKGLAAFRRIWEGCSVNVWNAEDMRRCSETVLTLVQQVRTIDLACTMDETAVNALEQLLV